MEKLGLAEPLGVVSFTGNGDGAGRGIHLTAGTKMFPPLPILKLHPCSFHSYLNNMAEKSQKFKSEVWNFFKVVEGGDKTKCNFCDVTLSYKSNSTKSMWDHLKAKHSLEMIGDKQSVKQKFGPVMKQSKLDMSFSQKFSKEKHETCYKASAEVCSNTSISENIAIKIFFLVNCGTVITHVCVLKFVFCVQVCAADLRPFSMFCTPAYRKYMRVVQPNYSTPVASTVRRF